MFAFFRSFVLLTALFFVGATVALADQPNVTEVRPVGSSSAAKTYDVMEWSVTLDQTVANPFDFDDTTVDAVFTRALSKHPQSPKSASLRSDVERVAVPGFWYEPFVRETQADKSVRMGRQTGASAKKPGWRIRFCPPAPAGKWTMRVWAKNKDGAKLGAQTLTFSVGDSGKPGMVRRMAPNRRYFVYDNKSPFFIVGENVCWADSRGLAAYDDWFPKLSQAGGNYARLWMAFQPLEAKSLGLTRYDMANAAHFDEVLRLAQANKLVCMLAFGTYGELRTGGYFNEGKWAENPYNKANGGPCEKPEDFFTSRLARQAYKKRLRYLVARYGAYSSLGFWEFWNEEDAPADWLHEMGAYIQSIDPYRHLITNSASTTARAESWQVGEMDLTQTHRYGDEGSIRDIAPGLPGDQAAHAVFNKPHLMGEFGISWRNPDAKFDPQKTATNFHNGLWAGAMSGNAGGAVLWWWDNYVGPQNLYSVFTPLSKFAKTVPWASRDFQPLLDVPAPRIAKSSGPETFSSVVLTPTASWGGKSSGAVVVLPDGRTRGTGTLISHLYGPSKPELRTPLVLSVDLPKPSTLVMRVLTVSQSATIRVLVNGKEAASFPFDAAPGKGEGYESTKQFPEYNNIYQALFNKDRSVALPQGKHTVTIENTSGDWVQIGSYTLQNALSSRFARLTPYVLQDAKTGETLVWLQDGESNWANDFDPKTPRAFSGVALDVPVAKAGAFTAQWWDTRTGQIVRTQAVRVANGKAALVVPPFSRDIALRLFPSAPIKSAKR